MRTTRRNFGAVAATGMLALAGCTAPGSDAGEGGGGDQVLRTADLRVGDSDAEWDTFGNINARVLVTNQGNERGTATLYFEAVVEGGRTYTRSKHVSVAAGESNTYEFEIDVEASDSLGGGGFRYDSWLE